MKEQCMAGKSNIVLIGMPGAGKSTIGVLLAKRRALDFVDTDILIQLQYGDALQRIVNTEGYLALRIIEEKVICATHRQAHVIATGGSAVYSAKAMAHLKKNAIVVFLDVAFAEIEKRVTDFDSRGIAMRADQTFHDLFAERLPLYQAYADLIIECQFKNQDAITTEICHKLDER
jgi:shikimate kinase